MTNHLSVDRSPAQHCEITSVPPSSSLSPFHSRHTTWDPILLIPGYLPTHHAPRNREGYTKGVAPEVTVFIRFINRPLDRRQAYIFDDAFSRSVSYAESWTRSDILDQRNRLIGNTFERQQYISRSGGLRRMRLKAGSFSTRRIGDAVRCRKMVGLGHA
jgi:hypothetical protein